MQLHLLNWHVVTLPNFTALFDACVNNLWSCLFKIIFSNFPFLCKYATFISSDILDIEINMLLHFCSVIETIALPRSFKHPDHHTCWSHECSGNLCGLSVPQAINLGVLILRNCEFVFWNEHWTHSENGTRTFAHNSELYFLTPKVPMVETIRRL